MNISISEIFVTLFILATGIAGNIIFYVRKAGKTKQIKWSAIIYGATILLLICSFISPPDVTSSIMVSAPLTIAYILIINKFYFVKLK